MKKLFTLLALLTCFLGANATEVVDVDLDFSTQTTLWGWGHGWVDGKYSADDSPFDLDDGCLHYHSDAPTTNNYDIQLQPFPGVKDLDASYTITIVLKGTPTGDQKQILLSFSGSSTPGMIDVPADFEELTFTDNVNNPNDQYFKDSGSILLQCGHWVGDFWIKSVKITHEEKEPANPITWIDMIKNGNAEEEWAYPDAYVANNAYQGEGAELICAYAKEFGYNDNNPHPAFIEDGVFYTTTVPVEDDPDGASEEWQNQFWINFPRPLKDGEPVRLSFRYKASQEAKAPGQGHRAPGDYLGGGIGDLTFTEDWQPFESTFDATGGMQSIAFNLGANNQFDKEITFYFDDIKLEYQQLEEGWFVAATDTEDGDPAYDYDNAVKFEEEGEDFVAIVGGESEDEWVNQVMISTARGTDKGFRSSTIKVDTSESPITNDPEDWHGYEAKGKTATDLPVRGQWKIRIANSDENLISFEKLAGEEDVEPEDIIVNATDLVIEGVERKYKSIDEATEDGVELPEGYASDVEEDNNPWGQPWDNQFWIIANEEFAGGEETTIEFDYYLVSDEITEAKVSSQAHSINHTYVHYEAIGDIIFTPTEQHFSKDWTIPTATPWGSAISGIGSIALNMAEIRPACTYVLKNVKWYMKSPSLNAEGKTTKNLIGEGPENFWVKIGAGTEVYQWGNKPAEFSPYDIDQNGSVNLSDVRKIINKWKAGEEGYNLAFARKAIIAWKGAE